MGILIILFGGEKVKMIDWPVFLMDALIVICLCALVSLVATLVIGHFGLLLHASYLVVFCVILAVAIAIWLFVIKCYR